MAKIIGVPVKVAKLGNCVKEVLLDDEEGERKPTVADALEAAKTTIDEGFEVRVNNREADEETLLEPNDVITLIPNVEGGATS